MFKVDNKGNRRGSGFFIVNFEPISHLVLVFLLLTFERAIALLLGIIRIHGKFSEILTFLSFLVNFAYALN